jgi:ABC-type dipeptide/oligopeptide/nickel transport system ATPase component
MFVNGTCCYSLKSLILIEYIGNPGCGKTVLASSIIQLLQDESDTGKSQRQVFYYLFDAANNPTNATPGAALRSLLFQVLQHNRRNSKIVDAFSFAMRTGHRVARQATLYELADLLMICLNILRDPYLVIDGLDECADEFLIRHLLEIAEQCQSRLLLLSRPNVYKLVSKVSKDCQIEVDQSCTDGDIRLYLTRQIRSLIDEGTVASTGNPLELVENLVNGANGMFLWAKLMVSYLRLPIFNPQLRLQTIRDVVIPEGLEKMYNRILDLIDGFGHTQRSIARRAFTWLLYSVEPLTSQQLQEVIIGHEKLGPQELMRHEDWQMTLMMACGGMVEVYWAENQLKKGDEPYFRLIHLSAHEYLRKFRQVSHTGSFHDSIPTTQSVISAELVLSCLGELENHAPAKPSSAVIGLYGESSTGRTAMLSSFTSYSYSHWVDHLAGIFTGEDIKTLRHDHSETYSKLATSLSSFLQNPVLISAWLEAVYTIYSIKHDAHAIPSYWVAILAEIGKYADVVTEKEIILSQLRKSLKLIKDLSSELEALESAWGAKLLSTPAIVWDESTAFLNCHFMLESTTAKVMTLDSNKAQLRKSSLKALAQISTTTLDGRYTAVLTVWPSKIYEQSWQDIDVAGSFISARHLCRGWIATFEMFAVDKEIRRVAQLDIPLEDTEIWIQLRQSLHRDTSSWRTSFPMAISEDAKSFVILRRLFVINSSRNLRSSSVTSVTIPMDFSHHLEENWFADTTTTAKQSPSEPTSLRWFPNLYTYFLTFSADGHYLCFTDSHRASYVTKSCLAVFEIGDSKDLNVTLVGGILYDIRFRHAINSITFHPTCDLVAIYNDGQVDIWRFRDGKYCNRDCWRMTLSAHS